MNFRVVEIEIRIVPFSQRIGYIKDTGLRFEGHAQSRPDERIVQVVSRHIILRPPDIEEGEKNLIEEALRQTNGNKARAAEALGISTRTLYRKIEKFSLSQADAGRSEPH